MDHMTLPTTPRSTLNTLANRPTVLVVDDDEDMVTLLKLSLERAGARVLSANSGSQALELTFQYDPDVILLDFTMPEMDGLTVCGRLRDLSDVPIIMVTGLGRMEGLTG